MQQSIGMDPIPNLELSKLTISELILRPLQKLRPAYSLLLCKGHMLKRFCMVAFWSVPMDTPKISVWEMFLKVVLSSPTTVLTGNTQHFFSIFLAGSLRIAQRWYRHTFSLSSASMTKCCCLHLALTPIEIKESFA